MQRVRSILLFIVVLFCVTQYQSSASGSAQRYRVGFAKPLDGTSLGLSFANFRNRVVIISITPGSPADDSGLVKVGNIVLAVNGQSTNTLDAQVVNDIINNLTPGARVIFFIEKHSMSSFSEIKDEEAELEEGEFLTTLKRGERGYGLQIQKVKGQNVIRVENIIKESSTAVSRALLVGDLIVAIDDEFVGNKPFREVMAFFTTSRQVKLRVKSQVGLSRTFVFVSTLTRPSSGSFGMNLKRDYDKSIHNCSIFIDGVIPGSVSEVVSKNAVEVYGLRSAALFAKNDRLVAIDGIDVRDASIPAVVKLLKGVKVGQSVSFKLVRVVYLPRRSGRASSKKQHNAQKAAQQKREEHQKNKQKSSKMYSVDVRKTKASGLGIRVTASSEGIMVEGVVDLYRNSIHIGDIIAAVDGSILRGLSFAESISILKAIPVGGRCTLTLQKSKTRHRRQLHNEMHDAHRQSLRRPDAAHCEVLYPESVRKQIGILGLGELLCAPAKFGPALKKAAHQLESNLVVPRPVHACQKLESDYSGKILLIPRGKCFFHEKAIHAQRAGAIAVLISNSRNENEDAEVFEMELPASQGAYATEPVQIPLAMISHTHGRALARYHGNDMVFRMYGKYDTGIRYEKKKRNMKSAQPIDPRDDPVEYLIDFGHGTLELNLGTPGAVGNPGHKLGTKLIEKLVPFDTLYTGGLVTAELTRGRLCPECHGHGGIEGGLKPCPHCSHHHDHLGRHVVHDTLGNMFSQKNEKTCSVCHGHGEVLKTPKARCPTCKGHGTVRDRKTFTVEYPAGMRQGFKKLFRREGNEARYGEAGDVEVVVKHESHPFFKRSGPNLITTVKISLSEALLGFNRSITLPDDTVVQAGQLGITHPGTTMEYAGLGLPLEREIADRNGQRHGVDRQLGMDSSGGRSTKGGSNNPLRGSLVVQIEVDFTDLAELRNRSRQKFEKAFNGKRKRKYRGGRTEKKKGPEYRREEGDTEYRSNSSAKAYMFGNIFSHAFRRDSQSGHNHTSL